MEAESNSRAGLNVAAAVNLPTLQQQQQQRSYRRNILASMFTHTSVAPIQHENTVAASAAAPSAQCPRLVGDDGTDSGPHHPQERKGGRANPHSHDSNSNGNDTIKNQKSSLNAVLPEAAGAANIGDTGSKCCSRAPADAGAADGAAAETASAPAWPKQPESRQGVTLPGAGCVTGPGNTMHRKQTLILPEDWNVDLVSRYNALLNAIALDDAATMSLVLRQGNLDPNLPIDVRRVRAISAPNYVVARQAPSDVAQTCGDGMSDVSDGQVRVVLARGHELRCPLLPTPVVVAALSYAQSCLRALLSEHGARIGPHGTGVTVEHLIEAVVESAASSYWVSVYVVDGEMPESAPHQWPRSMPPAAYRFVDDAQVMTLLLEAFPRSTAGAGEGKLLNAVHPFALLRREAVRELRMGSYLEPVQEVLYYMMEKLRKAGYSDQDATVCAMPPHWLMRDLERYWSAVGYNHPDIAQNAERDEKLHAFVADHEAQESRVAGWLTGQHSSASKRGRLLALWRRAAAARTPREACEAALDDLAPPDAALAGDTGHHRRRRDNIDPDDLHVTNVSCAIGYALSNSLDG
jgi:hypothetical protein